MPQSPEEIYARIVEAVGADGRLPMPPVGEWDSFPWEVVDGALQPKVLRPPLEAEPPGAGEEPGSTCWRCENPDAGVIWANDRWLVSAPAAPRGLPLILFLMTREHMDFTDMDDELAAEYGVLSARLCRVMSALPHIGRVHVGRWGDGSFHLHVWFIARPARLPGIVGSMAVEWDEMLPAPPMPVWRGDLDTVAASLRRAADAAT